MDVEAYVAALDREGRILVDAARRAGPAALVPTCPGWTVAHLLAHVGFVHRWATRYVATALGDMVEEPSEAEILENAPVVAERCDWVAEGHGGLVRALRSAPADLVCWTFLEAPSPLAMWARRQAHETAVHRVDAQLAAGSTTPVETELAADGIDELLFCFFGRAPGPVTAVPGAGVMSGGEVTIGLDPADRPERWTVRVSEGAVTASSELPDVDVDVRLRGTASDLYLLLWHLRPLRPPGPLDPLEGIEGIDGIDVDGPARLFEEAWGERVVTWG